MAQQLCQGAAASFQEAQQLAEGLLGMLSVLGPAYTELSGQAALAQHVVFNIQRSLAYLSARAGQEPTPLPWTTPLPAAGLLSGMDMPQRAPPAARSEEGPASASRTLTRSGSQPSPSSVAVSKQVSAAGQRATASTHKASVMASRTDNAAGASRTNPPSTRSAVGSPATQPQDSSSKVQSCRDPLQPLNLPRVAGYQLESSTKAFTATGQQQQQQGARGSSSQPAGPGPPPQLPAAFIRAELGYLQALQQCRESCHRSVQHQHDTSMQTGSSASPMPSWSGMLQMAGDSFRQELESYCQQATSSEAAADTTRLRHEAQVALAALVAAYTWVLQSLLDLVQFASQPAAAATQPPPDLQCVLSMLKELPVLQQEYDAAIAAVQMAEGGTQQGDRSSAAATSMQRVLVPPADRVAAAARWRNRFLRAMLQPLAAAKPTLQGGHAGSSTPPTVVHQFITSKQLQLPNSMVRPLGNWLPDIAWSSLRSRISDYVHNDNQQLGSAVQKLQADPAWLHALPPQLGVEWGLQHDLSIEMRVPCIPATVLPSPTAAASLSRSRANMQLQYHLMQLWLENSAGQVLNVAGMPSTVRDLMSARNEETHSRRMVGYGMAANNMQHSSKQVQRLLAKVRLAHLLTAKNAWNSTCGITQQGGAEEDATG